MKKLNKILFCFIIFFILCVFLFSKIKYQEDITIMLPSALSQEMQLFQALPLSNKLFVVVSSKDSNLETSVDLVKQNLTQLPLTPLTNITNSFLLDFYHFTPNLWTSELQDKASIILEKQELNANNEKNISALFAPQGSFVKDLILVDPIGLLNIVLPKLNILNFTNNNLHFNSGFFTDETNTKALLIYETAKNYNFDRIKAGEINKKISSLNTILPAGSSVFIMGAQRYTYENSEIISKDVKRIIPISVLLMLAIFLILFREKSSFFIYLVPLLVLIPSAVFTYYKFGFVSGITLGFASVLMGLAVDYSIYVFFAIKQSKEDKKAILKKIFLPISCSALTSIISFVILYFCKIPLFEQLSFFAIVGLVLALFIAFFIAPIFYKQQNSIISEVKFNKYLSFGSAVKLIFIIIILGCVCAPNLHFDNSLEALNSVSKQFKAERKIFDDLTGYAQNKEALLFVFGKDKEECLINSEKINSYLKQPLPLTKLFPSKKTTLENIQRWHNFWTDEKIKNLKQDINSYYQGFGFRTEIFDSFYQFLKTAQAGKDFDLTVLYNPFINIDNKTAMVHIVPEGFVLPKEISSSTVVLISTMNIQDKLFKQVIKLLSISLVLLFIINFIILCFIFKNIKLAFLAFVPTLCALSIISIIFVLFNIKLNLFSLFAVPLIIGLSIDYAIFIIHQNTLSKQLYPSIAVIAAALFTIAGFGALIFAKHAVLFSLGLVISIGIITSGIISVLCLPSLVKKISKIAPLFLIIFFIGCASVQKTEYSAKVTPKVISQEEFYGQMQKYNMLFIALVNHLEDSSVRIITVNDFGVKLCDVNLTSKGEKINYKLPGFPSKIIKDLNNFYRQVFLQDNTSIKTIGENGKIIYNNNSFSMESSISDANDTSSI